MTWTRRLGTAVCCLICLGLAAGLRAEPGGGQAGAFLKLGADARALGLGGAYTAVCEDSAAGFWNPAGLASMTRLEGSGTYAALPAGGDYSQVHFALPLNAFAFPTDERAGSTGSLPLGALGLTILRFAGSYALEARRIDSLNPDYLFSDIEGSYGLAYGHPFFDRQLSVGLGLKGFYHLLEREQASGWGLDAGARWLPFSGLTVALVLRNAYADLQWSTGARDRFPAVIHLGVAYAWSWLEAQDLLVSIEGVQTLSERRVPQTRAGLEYGFNRILFARGGWMDGAWAIGGGLRLPSIGWGRIALRLDYAAQTDRIEGWDHWVTLRLEM
ncbi:MAG: hypothetical protein AB1439_12750 [candidate division FCPU426 bacterium]